MLSGTRFGCCWHHFYFVSWEPTTGGICDTVARLIFSVWRLENVVDILLGISCARLVCMQVYVCTLSCWSKWLHPANRVALWRQRIDRNHSKSSNEARSRRTNPVEEWENKGVFVCILNWFLSLNKTEKHSKRAWCSNEKCATCLYVMEETSSECWQCWWTSNCAATWRNVFGDHFVKCLFASNATTPIENVKSDCAKLLL